MHNPFRYGDIVTGEHFTNRDREVAELAADIRSGQNLVILSPRRYGKTSLVRRVLERVGRDGVRWAYLDLLGTPTKDRLATGLARALFKGLISPFERNLNQVLSWFLRLGIRLRGVALPDGSVSVELVPEARPSDLDDVLERLFALPGRLAQERRVRVAVVFDEFQEITAIDPHLPAAMRTIFQQQGEVAHVFLGSRKHLMERVFTSENEPMYRLAKAVPLKPISRADFDSFIRRRFADTGAIIDDEAVSLLLDVSGGHPHATQELAHFAWNLGSEDGGRATRSHVEEALESVLEAESAHYTSVWMGLNGNQRLLLYAIAGEESRPFSDETRRRLGLGAPSTVHRAVQRLLAEDLVEQRPDGVLRVLDPLLARWIQKLAGQS